MELFTIWISYIKQYYTYFIYNILVYKTNYPFHRIILTLKLLKYMTIIYLLIIGVIIYMLVNIDDHDDNDPFNYSPT